MGGVGALALVLLAASPAAAHTVSGYKSCLSNQQYGVQTSISTTGSTSSTVSIHEYSNQRTYYFYGWGLKGSANVGVSSGGWEAYTPGTFTYANPTCAGKAA